MSVTTQTNLYDVLAERGLVSQCTEPPEVIRKRLSKPVVAYCGFDPTADSLHVGSLVPIMGLAHLQRCGHKPLVLVGGATGLVGDPSGKSSARRMLDEATIRHNADAIAKQISRVVKFGDGPTDAKLVNNIDWIGPMTWLAVLRDIGSKVSVNRMVTMESVKQRMNAEGDGISYLEFSYMLLQAIDFAHLFKHEACSLQLGGQDQWGNIVMGIELGRKLHAPGTCELAGLTFPLVTRSDGGKFGKSEAGNIWLDSARTPVFDFYQFWRNVDDRDVGRYLRFFTFLPPEAIAELENAQGAAINEAKVTLAYEITKLVHGEQAANNARDSAKKAFSGADVTGEAIPHGPLPDAAEAGASIPVLLLLQAAGFARSNGEARRLIEGGGVRIGDEKVSDITASVTAHDATEGYILLRAGKKKMYRFEV